MFVLFIVDMEIREVEYLKMIIMELFVMFEDNSDNCLGIFEDNFYEII